MSSHVIGALVLGQLVSRIRILVLAVVAGSSRHALVRRDVVDRLGRGFYLLRLAGRRPRIAAGPGETPSHEVVGWRGHHVVSCASKREEPRLAGGEDARHRLVAARLLPRRRTPRLRLLDGRALVGGGRPCCSMRSAAAAICSVFHLWVSGPSRGARLRIHHRRPRLSIHLLGERWRSARRVAARLSGRPRAAAPWLRLRLRLGLRLGSGFRSGASTRASGASSGAVWPVCLSSTFTAAGLFS